MSGPFPRTGGNPRSSVAAGPEVVLVVRDRPDALERLFGTLRRRGMDLQVLSLGRFSDGLVVVLRREAPEPVPGRWLAELEDLVDVREIRVTSDPLGDGHDALPDPSIEGETT